MEQWKTIHNYPNYKISNLGNIRNIQRDKLMKPYFRKGYTLVKLSCGNKSSEKKIHRLVAVHFISNPNNYLCINHKDENKSNNCVNNLEWCTHLYNNTYGTRIKRQRQKLLIPITQYSLNGEFLNRYNSINEAANAVNRDPTSITAALKDRSKTSAGFIWKYETKTENSSKDVDSTSV